MQHVFEHYERATHPTQGVYRLCPSCGTELAFNNTTHRQHCPACGFIHFRNPSPTVTVCIIRDGKVLLTKRAFPPGEGLWALPGGYIEFEEDFLSTGVREMKEETGLDVRITGIVNIVLSFISPRWHFLNICLLAEVRGGGFVPCDEFLATSWHLLDAPLPEMAFQEDVECLRLISSPNFQSFPCAI